ncbi:hypothetical protein EXN66_Car003518 [Channa argus]|uniref:Uncharacterized protein n=1 Tax=Channa argus TaxID=215402 RepID=A0A6G1PCU2_CHAAH|nr:hypothetical protein EXN66_Car003518 [Channa argus]
MTCDGSLARPNSQNCHEIFILRAMFGQIFTVHDGKANVPCLDVYKINMQIHHPLPPSHLV